MSGQEKGGPMTESDKAWAVYMREQNRRELEEKLGREEAQASEQAQAQAQASGASLRDEGGREGVADREVREGCGCSDRGER